MINGWDSDTCTSDDRGDPVNQPTHDWHQPDLTTRLLPPTPGTKSPVLSVILILLRIKGETVACLKPLDLH